MLLRNRNAVIYGGGAIGGAVAKTFAREGARVFVTGRSAAKLDYLAGEIAAAGCAVETAIFDVFNQGALDAHAAAVAGQGPAELTSHSTPWAFCTIRGR